MENVDLRERIKSCVEDAIGRTSQESSGPVSSRPYGVVSAQSTDNPVGHFGMHAGHLELPLLVFGGPYSNLRALLAMRARAADLGIAPSNCICTGDIVAYCVEPQETIAAIRDWACHVIAGNCEQQLAAGAGDCGCGFEEGTECDRLAKDWYTFANARISSPDREWMGSLPKTLSFSAGRDLAFLVVHGGIDVINRFVFRSQRPLIAAELEHADVVVAGHCGIPFIEKIEQRVWFNPGVIGMPANDGTTDTWYGLIETSGDHIALSTHRLGYDHRGAAAAMRKWGHANTYARSLITGLWPSLDVLPTEERESTGITIPAASLIVRR